MVAAPTKVQVYPSGFARETSSQARLPLAVGFASTTIGWCQISESLSVTMRVAMSAIPPTGYGKTKWMRRLGKSVCAFAGPLANTQAASPEVRPAPARDNNRRRTRFMASPSNFETTGATTMLVISDLRRWCYKGEFPVEFHPLKDFPNAAKDRLGESDRPPAEAAGLACIFYGGPARQHGQGGATARCFDACGFRGDRRSRA